MSLQVEQIPGHEWRDFSRKSHEIVFGETRPGAKDRSDFALVVYNDEGPAGYVTCQELDSETLYWQFGGAYPPGQKSYQVLPGAQLMVDLCRKLEYKRIRFDVKNDNLAMLKLATFLDARIVGVRTYNNNVLVEHHLELQ